MSSRVSLSAGAISQEVKASLARLGTDRLHSVWIDGPELRLMQLGVFCFPRRRSAAPASF